MRDLPQLAADSLRAALHFYYGLSNPTLAFLPLGNDSASFVYHVEQADGSAYLLKLRSAAAFSPASLAVPLYLHEHGIPHIVAPMRPRGQGLSVHLGAYSLSLYPLLNAHMAADVGLTDEQWRKLGATLQQIHTCSLPPQLQQLVPQEMFSPSHGRLLALLQLISREQPSADPVERELAAFCAAHLATIQAVLSQVSALGRLLSQRALPSVLCHADLHTWNILVERGQEFWIVDWDETVLAPKERDLMFVVGGIGRGLVSAQQTACFLEGYGAAVDEQALAYYRTAWAVQDMEAYVEDAALAPERSAEARRDALHGFISLFDVGNIIDIARAA